MGEIRLEDMLGLSVAERIDLIEAIWESIAGSEDDQPLTEAQMEELERRLGVHAKKPEGDLTWNEVKDKVRRRK